MDGVFITFEGVDGAGKTTQMDFIQDWLLDREIDVVRTREPGGTEVGEAVREILVGMKDFPIDQETELMLIFSARMQHVTEIILPSMAEGKWVLCDRFTDATYAYQGGGRGIDMERIARLEQWVQKGLQPDLTVVFDLPGDMGDARVSKRGEAGDRFERQGDAFREAVRNVYLDRAKMFPERVKVVDASGSIELVRDRTIAVIENFISSRSRNNQQNNGFS